MIPMAITLITGTPGAGKTAWLVQELTRLPAQRKLFVHGIPGLKIAHEKVLCKSNLCDVCQKIQVDDEENIFYLEKWPEWATPGSLIVADEVQRIWGLTNPSAQKTDDISRLQTHRHMGLDFWLIAQSPKLVNTAVRTLIGRHIHLVAKWSGRSEYEFPECKDDTSSRGDAVVRPYKLPKKVFSLYQSSSLHTKQTHRKPLALYAFGVLVLVCSFFGYKVFSRVSAQTHGQQAQELATTSPAQQENSIVPAKQTTSKKITPFPDFEPEIKSIPASAPAYRDLVHVSAVPHLIGCVSTPEACTCYSKQAVPVVSTPEFCREYLKGHYFNPYRGSQPENEHKQNLNPDQQIAQNTQTKSMPN